MADRQRQSPLTGILSAGRSGMLDKPGTVQLQHLQPLAMVQINGAADADILHVALSTFELERAPVPLQCVSGTQIRLLWNGR